MRKSMEALCCQCDSSSGGQKVSQEKLVSNLDRQKVQDMKNRGSLVESIALRGLVSYCVREVR